LAWKHNAYAAFLNMKSFVLVAALLMSAPVFGALPGVTEFKMAPEEIADAELSALLGERVAAADVIAIGETVHGSSAFLKLQARLIRYLVAKHGLRLIVWENPPLRSLELSRWLASCIKTRSPAPVDVLYFPTASDAPLLDWMCDFNRSNPGNPIVFRGMDVWDRPWEHYARIQSLGIPVGIDPARLKNIVTHCPAHKASTWAEVDAIFEKLAPGEQNVFPEADYQKCRALLTALLDSARQSGLDKQKKKAPGADDAFELAISASTLLGWLGYHHAQWSNDILSWNERDRAQGRNLLLLMAKHGASRAILSAHSSHVSHNRSPADWWGYGDLKSGVYFFTQITRKKVFNIALTAHEASGAQGEWSLPTAGNSLDKKLHDAGHGFSYFPSNAAFLSEHKKWWMQNQNSPGPYESGVEIVPRDHFDGFFFFKRSHLDKALPARPVWQP
jgi:erythromycin esterase-like protein